MNQPKTSKAEATPRPWKTNGLYITPHDSYRNIAIVEIDGSRGGKELRDANAALIVKAVNEYAALNAVAFTAKRVFDAIDTEDVPANLLEHLSLTLAQLATLRAKEGK